MAKHKRQNFPNSTQSHTTNANTCKFDGKKLIYKQVVMSLKNI